MTGLGCIHQGGKNRPLGGGDWALESREEGEGPLLSQVDS